MKNKDIIKQIVRWQKSNYVHGLTCRSDTCDHVLLEPIEKNGRIILVCPTIGCDYKQSYIPPCILSADIEKMERSIENVFNKIKGSD